MSIAYKCDSCKEFFDPYEAEKFLELTINQKSREDYECKSLPTVLDCQCNITYTTINTPSSYKPVVLCPNCTKRFYEIFNLKQI